MTAENETHLSSTTFAEFDLPEPVARGLAEAGFTHCTPIQAQTLPLALAGRDVAGQAQTGTGKTAAFLVATFTRLLRTPAAEGRRPTQPRAYIVAPTRELAIQIHKDAVALGRHCDLRLGLAYGGTDYDRQREEIAAGVDILIGTPGRLIDYLKQGIYDLRAVDVAILDEADRMFDLGFIADVRYLFRRMPPPDRRLSMLFSATLSYRVIELAYEHMSAPERVEVATDQVTTERVEQVLYHPANEEKIPLLIGLLRKLQPERSMIFINTKRGADRVWSWLEGNGFRSAVLSGDVHQRKRQKLLQQFQDGELPILIATDVAARGLHVPGVTHVFNFDLPQSAEDYVHRIGRTARAGASGHAVAFACEDYAFSVPEIEAYIEMKLPTAPVTGDLLPELSPPAKIERRSGQGGRAGKAGGPPGKGGPRPARKKSAGSARGGSDGKASGEGNGSGRSRSRRRRRGPSRSTESST